MKIAFSGFQGSGKTTAAHKLVAELKSASRTCNLVSGAARSSRRLLVGDVSLETHLEIIGAQLAMEAQALQFAEFAVCDRTVLDYIAYGRCRGLHKGSTSTLFEAASEFCRSYAQTYQVIIFGGGTFSKRDFDPMRRVSDVSEQCFNKELNDLLGSLAPTTQVIPVRSGNLFTCADDWLRRNDERYRDHCAPPRL